MTDVRKGRDLGYDVRVSFNGDGFWLETDIGPEGSSHIFLEPVQFEALRQFVDETYDAIAKQPPEEAVTELDLLGN